MGNIVDQNGMPGCDATCDSNGMDATGMACTATPPTPTPPITLCTFDAAGWSCDDGTSCQADAMGGTVDQTGAAGCDATCATSMLNIMGMDCNRRLAVQTMIGQN